MAKTIGNPLSWSVKALGHAGTHSGEIVAELGGTEHMKPVIQQIGIAYIRSALRLGLDDFKEMRTDVLFIALIYPIMGFVLAAMAFQTALIPLLFPLISGFALIGPAAGVGLYEMSRRREAGQPASLWNALGVVRSPNFGAIAVLSFYLFAVFVIWLVTAAWIHGITMGPEMPVSLTAFLGATLTTAAGWEMIVVGTAVGAVFAIAVLAAAAFAFPMMLDKHIGIPIAVMTSIRVAKANPGTVFLWGAVVAGGLVLGAIPVLLGLIVVMPVLGHATWHLYRHAVHFE